MRKHNPYWLLQPEMYHYRRALRREPNFKRRVKLMIEASAAFYGISERWKYRATEGL